MQSKNKPSPTKAERKHTELSALNETLRRILG